MQYFNNEKFEVAQYDKAMKDYTKASVKISTSLAALNIGQNVIFSSALTAMMYLACRGIVDGEPPLGHAHSVTRADGFAHRRDDDRW